LALIDSLVDLTESLAASTGVAAVVFELIFVVVILVVLVLVGYLAGKSVGGTREPSESSRLLVPSEEYSVDSVSLDEVTQTQETLEILEVEKTSATHAIKNAEKAYKSKKISTPAYQKLLELYSERLEKINSEIARRTSVVEAGTLEAEFERARKEALVELKGEEDGTEPSVSEAGLIEEAEVLEGPEGPPTGPPTGEVPTAPPTGPPTGAPPTAPPTGAPPTAPPTGAPPTAPPTGAPPTGEVPTPPTPPAPTEEGLVDTGMATVASLRSEMLSELRRLKKYMQKPSA
jgi:hypothetical protein